MFIDVHQLHRIFQVLDRADMLFFSHSVELTLSPHLDTSGRAVITLRISCEGSTLDRSPLAQICSSKFPPMPFGAPQYPQGSILPAPLESQPNDWNFSARLPL